MNETQKQTLLRIAKRAVASAVMGTSLRIERCDD